MTDPNPRPHSAEVSDLAALFAIDALEPGEFSSILAALGDTPEFMEEVAAYQAAVAVLPYDLPPLPMASDLKDRLFQRMERDTAEPPSELFQLLSQSVTALMQQAKGLTWKPLPVMAGASQAILKIDQVRRNIAFFIRAEQPGQLPLHYHATGEEVLVLEGDFVVDGQRYEAGDRIYSPAHTAHTPTTFKGCLIFCVTSLDDQCLM